MNRFLLAALACLFVVPALAQTYTALDPNYKSSGITLSGSNLIATETANPNSVVRGAEGKTAGKWYYEVTWTTLTSAPRVGIGSYTVAGDTVTTGSPCGGSTGFNLSSNRSGTALHQNGNWFGDASGGSLASSGVGSYTSGQRLDFAVDMDNRRIWVRKAGGNWNGNAANDPATNTGGFSIDSSTAFGPRVWPCASPSATNESATFNFGTTSFAGTPPSGFSGWTSTYSYDLNMQPQSCNSSTTHSNTAHIVWVGDYTPAARTSISTFLLLSHVATSGGIYGVIYDSDGTAGAPGTLVAQSTAAVTTGTKGTEIAFTTNFGLTASHKYYVGLYTPAGITTWSGLNRAAATAAYTCDPGSGATPPGTCTSPTTVTGACMPTMELVLAAAPIVAGPRLVQ